MSYHHLALVARDIQAIHEFYEGVMGFELVKVEIERKPGGWAKLFFYRMGDDTKLLAFWELHGVHGCDTLNTNISKAANFPDGMNHIAFEAKKTRPILINVASWLRSGRDVTEIDYGWCRSIYTKDPNDNTIEFCLTTGALTVEDRNLAVKALKTDELSVTESRGNRTIRHLASQFSVEG